MLYVSPVFPNNDVEWIVINIDAWLAHHMLDLAQAFRVVIAHHNIQLLQCRLPATTECQLFVKWPELRNMWAVGSLVASIHSLPVKNRTTAVATEYVELAIRPFAVDGNDVGEVFPDDTELAFTLLAKQHNGGIVESCTFRLGLLEDAAAGNINGEF